MASNQRPSLLALDPENSFSGMTTSDAEGYFQQHPGAAPGGTGDTGLAPNDAKGWSDLMGMQDAYLQATNSKTTIKGQMQAPNLGPSVASNPNWWMQGSTAQDPMQGVPPSLRPLMQKPNPNQG